LLAIANALLLRNQINLPARCITVGNIHIQQLLSIVAEHMLDANKETKQLQEQQVVVPLNEAYLRTETIRQNISDAISILPKLLTGVDVNPKFMHCKGFEFTDEVAIFDLLDISLFHGWLVDPNSEAAEFIGQLSYNQLVERIIEWDVQMLDEQKEEKKLAPMGAPVAIPEAKERSVEEGEEEERERVHVSLSVLSANTSGGDLIDLSDDVGTSAAEELIVGEKREENPDAAWVSLNLTTEEMSSTDGGQPSTSKASPHGEERQLCAYQTIQDFLRISSSQLTTEGLFALQREMKDRELAVFFRNNHFSTIFKHKDQLHLLMTDSGYGDLPLCVWEVLTDVAGNTQIVDGKFTSQVGQTSGVNVNGSDASHMLSQMGLSDGQGEAKGSSIATDSAVSPKAVDKMYANEAGQMSDADFALALQMQEEETIYNEQRDRRRQEEEDNLALVRRMQEEEDEHARRRMAAQQQQQHQQHQQHQQQHQQQHRQEAGERNVSKVQKVKDKCSIM
jgi:hypothetical protein